MKDLYIEMPDDCRISALYHAPTKTSAQKFKAVILVHGFAAEKTENGLFLEAASRLSSDGFGVLAYDWRGLGRSDGNFANSRLENHVSDFRSIYEWFCDTASVAPSEVCVVGFSLGATVVAQAVKGGVNLGGAVFLSPATRPALDMWPRYNTGEMRKLLFRQGFVIKNNTNVRLGPEILYSLRDTDLGDHAFNLGGVPLLICHGSNDTRIPLSSSHLSFDAIAQKVNNVYFAEFCGASHSFKPGEHYRVELMKLLMKWLKNADVRERESKKYLVAEPKSRTLPQVAARLPRRATQAIARVVGKHSEAAS